MHSEVNLPVATGLQHSYELKEMSTRYSHAVLNRLSPWETNLILIIDNKEQNCENVWYLLFVAVGNRSFLS